MRCSVSRCAGRTAAVRERVSTRPAPSWWIPTRAASPSRRARCTCFGRGSGRVALLVRLVVRLARRVLLLAGRVLLVGIFLARRRLVTLSLLFGRARDGRSVGILAGRPAPALLAPPTPAPPPLPLREVLQQLARQRARL